jgi:hypothetical protein
VSRAWHRSHFQEYGILGISSLLSSAAVCLQQAHAAGNARRVQSGECPMLGFAVGIEALYQRPLWLLFALAEVLRRTARARDSASPLQARADEAH